MSQFPFRSPTRRGFLAGSAALLATPALSQANDPPGSDLPVPKPAPVTVNRRNISSFRAVNWEMHFKDLKKGAILADTQSRTVHFWSEDQSTYLLFPSSVPLTEELTRRGRTSVVRKVEGPSWRPTPNMLKRNPEWPAYIAPGPDNPLGTHALYLSWKYYRIHGTQDTRKIGRQSSNGCIGLYNEHIAKLFGLARIGTQVLLI